MYRAKSWRNAAGRALLISSSLFLSCVCAAVSFEGDIPSELDVGTSYDLQWTTDANNIKVTLVSGSKAGNNLYHLYDVVCGVWIVNDLSKACTSTDDSVDWTPGDDLPVGRYMLMANAADGSTAFSSEFDLVPAGGADPSGTRAASGSMITSLITTMSGTSAQVITTLVTAAPGSTGTPSNPENEASSGELSTGTKAGIGVGAAVGGLVLLGALGFLLFRMGKRAADEDKHKEENGTGEEGAATDGTATDPTMSNDTIQPAGETGIAELQAQEIIYEAPDNAARLEPHGKREFLSELDATGGSFVIPPPSPPNTADAATPPANTDKDRLAPKGMADVGRESAKKEGRNAASESGDTVSASDRSQSPLYDTPDDVRQ